MKTSIFLICFFVLSFCCNEISAQKEFVPDTTINNLFFLLDANSSKGFCPNINDIEVLDEKFFLDEEITFLQDPSPLIIFFNADKTKYLIAFAHYGSWKYKFAEFEIGYVTEIVLKELKNRYIETSYKNFQTESKLRLGMTLSELEDVKGKNYIRDGNIVTYVINDENSDFLEEYNMPEYYLKCELSQNKVCKIRFGFTYP